MEQLAIAPASDAHAGRGDARPARHRRPAAPGAARAVRRPAAAGRDRRRADRAPAVLVLDEPTSALDPTSAEDVLAAITRLVHDLGVTVVLAEHRLERVLQYADRVIYLPGDGTVTAGAAGRDARPDRASRRRSSSSAGWPAGIRCRCRSATPAARGPAARAAARSCRPVGCAAGRGPTAATRLPDRARHRRPLRRAGRRPRRRPGPARRRGHRADGPQRLGQVLAAVGAAGLRPAARAARSASADGRGPGAARRAAGPAPRRPGAADARRPALPRHRRRPSSPRPTASPRPATRIRARPRASCSIGIAPGIAADTHPRDLSDGQRLALVLADPAHGRPAGARCSTSRPAGSTTGQSGPDRRSSTGSPRGGTRRGRHPRRRVRRHGRATGSS